jgi:hypothetical protein
VQFQLAAPGAVAAMQFPAGPKAREIEGRLG